VTVDCHFKESSLSGVAYGCDQTTGSGLSPLPVPHTFNAFEVARSIMDWNDIYVNGTSVEPVVTPVRANLADFQGHVPVDAYVAAVFADPHWHTHDTLNSTIHEDWYHPTLIVPSLFQRLDPAWKDCATTRGVKDPPLTLPTESTLPKLTLRPNIPIAASLSPAASLQTPWASPTASSLFKTLMDEIPFPGSNNYPESIVTKIIIQTVSMAQNSGVFVGGQKVEPSATPITQGLQRDGYDSHNLFIHGSIPETQKLEFQDTLTLSGDAVIVGSKTVSAGHAALTTLQHTISVGRYGVVRDGVLIPFSTPGATIPMTMAVFAGGNVVIGTITLSKDASALTTLGHTISVVHDGVVINGDTTKINMSFETQPTSAEMDIASLGFGPPDGSKIGNVEGKAAIPGKSRKGEGTSRTIHSPISLLLIGWTVLVWITLD
jgi:hypothetical protein